MKGEVEAQLTLLSANSSFCCRSGHTVVISGSRRSSQSTSSPQLRPDLVTSDLLEEETEEQNNSNDGDAGDSSPTKQKGHRKTNQGRFFYLLLISQHTQKCWFAYTHCAYIVKLSFCLDFFMLNCNSKRASLWCPPDPLTLMRFQKSVFHGKLSFHQAAKNDF